MKELELATLTLTTKKRDMKEIQYIILSSAILKTKKIISNKNLLHFVLSISGKRSMDKCIPGTLGL